MGEKNNESHLGPESAGCACLCMRVHLLHNYLCMPPTDGWKSNESFFNFHFVNYFFFGPQTWDACTFRDKYSGLACGHKEAVCIHGKLYTEPQTRVFTFKLVRGIEGDSHAAIIVHFCWWSNDFFRGVCFSFIFFLLTVMFIVVRVIWNPQLVMVVLHVPFLVLVGSCMSCSVVM